MSLILDAIRFVQKKIPMYLAALPIDALDNCSIDKWDPKKIGNWKGYQRGLVESKIANLAQYLERKDGILPVAGLLNVRERNRLKFKGKKSSYPIGGKLTIPDYTQLWVVDMQHRLEGIKAAFRNGHLKEFFVPVLITEGLDGVNEAVQFYVINTKSTRMGVDLTRRLLIEHDKIKGIADVKEWELNAVRIAIYLNKKLKDNNPWFNKIKEPECESLSTHIATEKSFIPSLKWLLNAPDIKNKSVRHLARFLANYWEGIRLNLPKAFEYPKGYVIQKTAGYMALHRIAPLIYRKTKKKQNVKVFSRIFRPFSEDDEFNIKFWDRHNAKGAKGYGTGQSAYTLLANDLKNKLRV